jgi:hypothetical protein
VGPMPDPELQWIPDQTAQAIRVRTRAISAAVLAVSAIIIGIVIGIVIGRVIGRLTASIPATRSVDLVSVPSAKKPAEPVVERPSLALKSDPETTTQKPAVSPTHAAESKPDAPRVLNPGTADKNPSVVPEERTRPVRERNLQGAPQENRERQAIDDRSETLSRPARNYWSLRQYMLSR